MPSRGAAAPGEAAASWAVPGLIAGATALLSACGGGEPLAPPQAAQFAGAPYDPSWLPRPESSANALAAAPATLEPEVFLDWAQSFHAALFPGPATTVDAGSFVYRYFPGTGNYLAVMAGDVYAMGPPTQGRVIRIGALADFRCVVYAGPCLVAAPTAAEAARFLAQATLGASKADIAAVQALGYAAWIDAQLAAPRSTSHCDWLVAKGYNAETFRNSTQGLDHTLWRKLIGGSDALRQRMVLALSEICVVSIQGVSTSFAQFAVAHHVDLLENNAFGNYRTLLGDISLSTAMGYYLTFRGNAKANASGSQPDENYARELMQLFTIGLVPLNADGTSMGGESYGPDDVSGLARVFTGWDLNMSGAASVTPDVHRRPMSQVASRHENGSKSFLGITIPAGTPAATALNMALDTLFAHPNLPPFVSRQLIQRLVTSNPSPAYVGRVSTVFSNNGSGVRGDLAAVLRAILTDTEARDAARAADPAFGKLREPVVRFLNWARGWKAASATDAWAVGDLSDPATRLGQSPMRASSVFNFFRPGYVPPNSPIAVAGLAGPEFQITTESSVAGYVNFMQRAVNGAGVGDLRCDYSTLLALATNSTALLDEINLVLAAGQVSADTLAQLKTALDTIAVTTDTGRQNRVNAALTLVLAAPEYIVQK